MRRQGRDAPGEGFLDEAFSLLEDQDSPVELPRIEVGEGAAVIRLPPHLYVIGTMNLIDQSLEQIDFALRRRFLWKRSGFSRERLDEVLRELWEATDLSGRYPWERVSPDMAKLAGGAEALNAQIEASPSLGGRLRDRARLLLQDHRVPGAGCVRP